MPSATLPTDNTILKNTGSATKNKHNKFYIHPSIHSHLMRPVLRGGGAFVALILSYEWTKLNRTISKLGSTKAILYECFNFEMNK